ncbi:ROK family transcriptional regulator [Halovulum dunhuangense]|uniref:ROK family transcriptional regulator n=2 Tax=Halovulum dunhuangense TaxID=1505036 RepID=A0A849KXC0_9RHOB|nr:ROK family transcriptional regulator [Halovulum dunhuangense]
MLDAQPTDGCGPIRKGPGAPPLKQQIFECIRSAGRIARVDVAKELGVSAGSVTTLSSELIRDGFLIEAEGPPRDTGRGRPPVALGVRPEAGHVVGIKLSDEMHTAVVVDFAGRPVAEASLPAAVTGRSLATTLDEAETIFRMALDQANLPEGAVQAAGVGLPGLVDHVEGMLLWSPIFRDRRVPLRSMLADRLGLRVQIDNDVNLLTLAELWYGSGRALSNFAVVTIEQGVGMGLVLGDKLYRGAHGYGTELGHTKVQLDGALCRCGQRGCLEAYVSDYALVREATAALGLWGRAPGSTRVLLEALFDEAKAGNEAARSIFRRAGRFLSVGLANVVTLFDPPLVILSGARMRYDYLYASEMLEEARRLTLDQGRPAARVEIHAWGDWVWARGAATLALADLTDVLISGEAA